VLNFDDICSREYECSSGAKAEQRTRDRPRFVYNKAAAHQYHFTSLKLAAPEWKFTYPSKHPGQVQHPNSSQWQLFHQLFIHGTVRLQSSLALQLPYPAVSRREPDYRPPGYPRNEAGPRKKPGTGKHEYAIELSFFGRSCVLSKTITMSAEPCPTWAIVGSLVGAWESAQTLRKLYSDHLGPKW
jgi:hypothetical protein